VLVRILSCLLVGVGVAAAQPETPEAHPSAPPGRSILLATTTSVRDSGLLDVLLPSFTEATGIKVRVVAVGSGAALRMGAEGNADVLITHAPPGEHELLGEGAVASRVPFMENHFVLLGPRKDPAKVRKSEGPADAFRRMASTDSPYVSRADDSGTHRRETALLAEAGLDPGGGWPNFHRTGSGMGLTLQVAGEKQAYVLSDLATWLAFRERIGLVPLSRPSPALRNEYSVLRVNPAKFPIVKGPESAAFESYLLEPSTQARIAEFGREKYGRGLFRPLARASRR